MGKGLVSKSRTEKQNIMTKIYSKQREETKYKLIGQTKSKVCECGTYTAGIFKDGKMRCHKCLKPM